MRRVTLEEEIFVRGSCYLVVKMFEVLGPKNYSPINYILYLFDRIINGIFR